jgi:hypothetical protein
MPKNKRGIFLILLIFILLNNKCLTLIINLILPDNTTSVLLYQNGSYNTEFIENSQKFNCSLSNLYTYSQSYPQNQNNTPYYLTFTDIDQPITFNLTT